MKIKIMLEMMDGIKYIYNRDYLGFHIDNIIFAFVL